MNDPEPTIDLTPAVARALARLRPSCNSRRGVNMTTAWPLRQWTEAVDDEQVAAHLGITLPTFPALTARGCTTSCRSHEGEQLFEHPVPSTGVGWMRINYGLALLQDRDDDDEDELAARGALRRPDRTRLAFRDGSPITIVRRQEEQTGMWWRSTVGGATFDIELVLPLPPLRAVRALAEAASIPLRRR